MMSATRNISPEKKKKRLLDTPNPRKWTVFFVSAALVGVSVLLLRQRVSQKCFYWLFKGVENKIKNTERSLDLVLQCGNVLRQKKRRREERNKSVLP